ncbi:MAG: hypothetical protein Fur0035_03610 [Anaerolineales bacterium]
MSKRQELRAKRQKQEQSQRLIIGSIIILGALLVAAALIWSNFKPIGEVIVPAAKTRPMVDFNAMGDKNAPVTIVEYSDFQCPYCANFSNQTEQQLIDAFIATGKVRFVYRSYGEFIGPESRRTAEAAYCAGDQGKFWEMHDIIFANQNGENVGNFSDRKIVAFAEKIGLDMGQFNDCFNSNKYADQVTQDGLDGQQAGVKATPSFTINGTLFEGAQPIAAFQTAIEAALAAAGK